MLLSMSVGAIPISEIHPGVFVEPDDKVVAGVLKPQAADAVGHNVIGITGPGYQIYGDKQ